MSLNATETRKAFEQDFEDAADDLPSQVFDPGLFPAFKRRKPDYQGGLRAAQELVKQSQSLIGQASKV